MVKDFSKKNLNLIPLYILKNHIIKKTKNIIEISFSIQNNLMLKKELIDILYFIYLNFLISKKNKFKKLIFKIQSKDNVVMEFFIEITHLFFYITNPDYFSNIVFILQTKYKDSDIVLVSVVLDTL